MTNLCLTFECHFCWTMIMKWESMNQDKIFSFSKKSNNFIFSSSLECMSAVLILLSWNKLQFIFMKKLIWCTKTNRTQTKKKLTDSFTFCRKFHQQSTPIKHTMRAYLDLDSEDFNLTSSSARYFKLFVRNLDCFSLLHLLYLWNIFSIAWSLLSIPFNSLFVIFRNENDLIPSVRPKLLLISKAEDFTASYKFSKSSWIETSSNIARLIPCQ